MARLSGYLKGKPNPRKPRKPTQKATLTEKATSTKTSTTKFEQKMLERIEKCLSDAYQSNASEQESKTALPMAQRLMAQHNVTQADEIANDTEKNKSHYGGQTTVIITKVNGRGQVYKEAFVPKLARAMCIFFDCKWYARDNIDSIEWCFYGIAENTVTAATAFEKEHNRILEWACEYMGGTATHSYRLRVADGLVAIARREKNMELEFAKGREIEYAFAENEVFDATTSEVASRTVPLDHQDVSDIDIDTNQPLADLSTGERDIKAKESFTDHGRSSTHDDDNDSDTEEDESEDFGLETDFKAKDVEAIHLCGHNIDETIDRPVKRDTPETLAPISPPKSESRINLDPNAENADKAMDNLTDIKREKSESPMSSAGPEPQIKSDPDLKISREPKLQSTHNGAHNSFDSLLQDRQEPQRQIRAEIAMPPPSLPLPTAEGARVNADAVTDTGIEGESEPEPELQLALAPSSSPWESVTQLIQFRATAEQVAKDYLRDMRITLRKKSERKRITGLLSNLMLVIMVERIVRKLILDNLDVSIFSEQHPDAVVIGFFLSMAVLYYLVSNDLLG
ncbi:hypothetical protein N7478_010911 [Penicillium angulare]|uniref:uncharacterized protein n=1 Tax=Penicillium angulare TaxID=116970 RepID=UPI002541578F|nr:uncharacterized protein N7478_010911 [Penicillium angulare]KAJ5263306.1 hypothetical protein N7478_010911 [Penicillium angulare]